MGTRAAPERIAQRRKARTGPAAARLAARRGRRGRRATGNIPSGTRSIPSGTDRDTVRRRCRECTAGSSEIRTGPWDRRPGPSPAGLPWWGRSLAPAPSLARPARRGSSTRRRSSSRGANASGITNAVAGVCLREGSEQSSRRVSSAPSTSLNPVLITIPEVPAADRGRGAFGTMAVLFGTAAAVAGVKTGKLATDKIPFNGATSTVDTLSRIGCGRRIVIPARAGFKPQPPSVARPDRV